MSRKTPAEAVAASQAKARAEGRIRLAGYLSVEGSRRLERLAQAHGGRVAAIEALLAAADEPAMSPQQALRVLEQLVGEA